MSATLIVGVLLAVVILLRRVRWIVMTILLGTIGYYTHRRMDFWPHGAWRDRTAIQRH